MTKAFLDFEFNNSDPSVVDIISVAVVTEKSMYYGISREFNIESAMSDEWLRENVMKKIFEEHIGLTDGEFNNGSIATIVDTVGKTVKELGDDVYNIVNPKFKQKYPTIGISKILVDPDKCQDKRKLKSEMELHGDMDYKPSFTKFYGWHSEFDWICLCILYGGMKMLPIGYAPDMVNIKQYLTELCDDMKGDLLADNILDSFRKHPIFQSNKNAHHPLDDAKWNMEVYNLIKTVKKKWIQRLSKNLNSIM